MSHDVLVCGAGPAGAVCARRLAAQGMRVALVGPAGVRGCEGLSARTRELLLTEGAAERGLLRGPLARRGVWAQGRVIEGVEWLAERAALAATLGAAACEAGADRQPERAVRIERGGDADGVGERSAWRIRLSSGALLEAPLLIDARGRRGGAALRGPSLLAVGQRYRTNGRGDEGTGVGVWREGWAWWGRVEGEMSLQVVGDAHGGGSSSWIAKAQSAIPALAQALAGAAPVGRASLRPAQARRGWNSSERGIFRVGDAAMALDPLSGQGVYEAVRGAVLVATAVLSVSGGTELGLAQRFVDERQQESWLRGLRLAVAFYEECGELGPFWSGTAARYAALLGTDAQRGAAAEAGAGTDGGAGAGAARVERRAVLDAGQILEREVIVTAAHPRGVWHVGGVPLAALKRYLDGAPRASVSEAAAALDRPAAAVASAAQWLKAQGCSLGG